MGRAARFIAIVITVAVPALVIPFLGHADPVTAASYGVQNAAPAWPFIGWLNYSAKQQSLEFIDPISGRVVAAVVAKSKWECVPLPEWSTSFVELSSGPTQAVYRVPWGDFAYPSFVAGMAETVSIGNGNIMGNLPRIDRFGASALLAVTIGQDTQFYRDSGYGASGALEQITEESLENALARLDADGQDHTSSSTSRSSPRVPISTGATGSHYSFLMWDDEPACPAAQMYVINRSSGAVDLCVFIWGGGLGGPVLVGDTTDIQDLRYLHPETTESIGCEPGSDVQAWLDRLDDVGSS